MKKLDIWVRGKETANRVEHETTLLAMLYDRRGQGELYGSIVMDADQLLVFRTYFKEGAEMVRDRCSAYTKLNRVIAGEDDSDVTRLDEDLFLTLHLPDSFPDVTASGIDRAITEFLTAWVVFRWLEMKLPQEAQVFRARSEQHINSLLSRLERRDRPVRRRYRLF